MSNRSDKGIKTISVDTLRLLLLQSTSDEWVAEQAGCSLSVVATARSMMMHMMEPRFKHQAKPEPTQVMAPKLKARPTHQNPADNQIELSDIKANKMMEYGSRQLLIKQLETGQHWLNKERFLHVCRDAGLSDRIPTHLMF